MEMKTRWLPWWVLVDLALQRNDQQQLNDCCESLQNFCSNSVSHVRRFFFLIYSLCSVLIYTRVETITITIYQLGFVNAKTLHGIHHFVNSYIAKRAEQLYLENQVEIGKLFCHNDKYFSLGRKPSRPFLNAGARWANNSIARAQS